MIGASGTVRGVTLFEGADAAPVPATFVAATVKVYAVPFASPVTAIGSPHRWPSGRPGSRSPCTRESRCHRRRRRHKAHRRLTVPAVAVPMIGASGTVRGVTLFEGADAAPCRPRSSPPP